MKGQPEQAEWSVLWPHVGEVYAHKMVRGQLPRSELHVPVHVQSNRLRCGSENRHRRNAGDRNWILVE
jgi:hypothetical protein